MSKTADIGNVSSPAALAPEGCFQASSKNGATRVVPAAPWTILALLPLAVCLMAIGCNEGGSGGPSGATSLDPPAEPEPPGDQPAFPFIDHVDQANVTNGSIGFEELFVLGDEIFETQFNSIDGVGVLELPDGTPLPSRFSRVPPGGGRFTGPN